ncbi:MAG TPA: PA2169 family four-helix-bundle protein [Pyrinomonadaceae bacterium]|nr:PA2169 family four-helix-bundle protein [Pyrinomonadaceae bacterium]
MINETYNAPNPDPGTTAGETKRVNETADAPTNDDMISTLNGLIETCRDGQEGFKEAAEGVERSDLKSIFYEYSQQRASFVGDLQSLVQTLGGDPENTGSFAGTLHRGWINIKSAVTGQDDAAILNEAERGEDSAKNAYKDALALALPDYIRQTVEKQYAGVQEAHDKVKALRDAANNEGTEQSNTARTGF